MFTLRQWQTNPKSKTNLIINASATDGTDSPQPFPIGLSFNYLKVQNLETQIGKHKNTVFCGLRDYKYVNRLSEGTHRSAIIRTLLSNGIENTLLPAPKYFLSLPNYKFVISPEGNGVDCHRHYEALMAGCIPVVEESKHIREVYGNCPILYTTDYSEITPEYLLKKYDEMIDRTYDFSRLFISTYPPNMQTRIRNNSYYWTDLLAPQKFTWNMGRI